MGTGETSASFDEYVARFALDVQTVLREVRAIIRAAAPEATETISYAIPTFDLAGRHLIHFAAYQRHIGVYPVTSTMTETLGTQLQPFKRGRGSVQFLLGRPIPADLLRRMVELRSAEVVAKSWRPGRGLHWLAAGNAQSQNGPSN